MPKGKEKSKQLSPHRVGTLRFIILWTLPQITGWVVTGAVWQLFRDVFISQNQEFLNALLVTMLPGMIAAAGHRWLIQRDTGASMRGWMRFNLVGWVMSGLIFYQLFLVGNISDDLPSLATSLFLPAALVQAVWLHRRVKNAWLWAMASIASAFVFMLPAQASSSDAAAMLVGLGVAGLLQGSIMGMTMRHLWSTPREKDKRDALSLNDETALDARDRLMLTYKDEQHAGMPAAPEEYLTAAGQRQVQ